MRLHRSRSNLSFRRQRRSMGCLSFILTSLLLAGAGAVVWSWVNRLSDRAIPGIAAGSEVAAAQAAFDQGDLSSAIARAQQALAANPEDLNALYILTRAFIYRSYAEYNLASDRERALTFTREAIERAPTDRDVMAIHAMALQAAERPADAADFARRALEEPVASSAIARTALALALDSVGSYDQAVQESLRAVQEAASRPALVDALRSLALGYRDIGRYADAVATVDRALELEDRLLVLHFERAQYSLLLGDSDSATVSYFEVLTRDVNNIKARLRLCELSSIMRERERAVEYCEEVTERAPSWYEGWYRLGMEYFLQGNFEKAQNSLHRCTTLQTLLDLPTSDLRFECWYIQGQAAEIRGDCPSLVAVYNEWRAIAVDHQVRERWTYPPEGPPNCAG
ncbi:MAG: tetratricopeptide repeat protein [Chloroflexi bacterium]|nr:tetratricopeptide repeat protein [Chloroflexota bacterium]